MSFPKAKIHRFNEDISCAPPPGRYDPKLDSKVKGVVLPTSKRFPDQLCASSSLDSLDKTHATQITFRTPQVTKKIISLTPRIKSLLEQKFDTPGSNSSTSSDLKLPSAAGSKKDISRADYQRLESELSALTENHMCELMDRELEISKLKEDLKEIQTHEAELKAILEEKSQFAVERNKEVLELKNNITMFEERINEERENHKKYIEELKAEILKLQTKQEDLEGIIAEKQVAIVTINDKYLSLEKQLLEEQERYLEEMQRLKEINSEIIHQVVSGSEQKLEEFECNLQSKTNYLTQQFDAAEQKVQVDFQSKLNCVSHEFELKTQDIEGQLGKCFARIKELEKIVQQGVKQCSLKIEEVDDQCKYLYRELCKVEQQRDELLVSDLEKKLSMIDIQEKSNQFEKDLEQCRNKCRKFEITLSTMHETVKALSTRLLESENEVERLSNVEIDLEKQKKILEEKSLALLSDISALRESMDVMEQGIICDVTAMKEHLAAKVEYFQAEAAKQISVLNNRILEKQYLIDMLLSDNESYKSECKKQEEHILHLQKEYSKAEDDFVERLAAQKNVYKLLSDKYEDATQLLRDLENQKANHEHEIKVLTAKVEQYKQTVESVGKEVKYYESRHLEQQGKIQFLVADIELKKHTLEKQKEKEIEQQKYVDELISDLVLEKERSETLVKEKLTIKSALDDAGEKINEKMQESKQMMKQIELLERSLRNAEEKITLIEDAKSTVETQLIESEKNITELNNVMLKNNEQYENDIKSLQQSLNASTEKFKTEVYDLEQDNINKAKCILDLSLSIDNLNDNIKEYETKITCLEAEKCNLNLQLTESNNKNDTLERALEAKNITINNLTVQLDIAKGKYEETLIQMNKLHNALNKQTEEMKLNLDLSVKLSEAEDKIAELQEALLAKDIETANSKERDTLEMEYKQLKEQHEDLTLRLSAITEERDKANNELAELLGHQNIHQKIKHVYQLKQHNKELSERIHALEIENARLKKKLTEFKENDSSSHPETTPKSLKQKNNKKCLSPGVLKERNH